MESRLLLDVVVSKGVSILELLAGKDETLLVRRNSLLVLDLCLHSVDAVRRLNLKSDGLASEGLDKDLHVGWLVVGDEAEEKEVEKRKGRTRREENGKCED